MEALGLVVGIAGLFGTCLDVLDRVSDFRDANRDWAAIYIVFQADRTRFRRWGSAVGISSRKATEDHHPALDDRATAETVHAHLSQLQAILTEAESKGWDHLLEKEDGITDVSGGIGQANNAISMPTYKSSKYRRLMWSLRDARKHATRCEQFHKILESLLSLIPVEDGMHDPGKNYEYHFRPNADLHSSWCRSTLPGDRRVYQDDARVLAIESS